MARRPRLQPRERRLDALGAWLGPASALVEVYSGREPPAPRIRTFSEAAPDDLRTALGVLSGVSDLGIVVHGPRGCAVGATPPSNRIAITDLDQRDTVLGSGEALALTIRRLAATASPAAIVVLGSPVVAINNDDIRATIAEVGEELGKPVVWARTDGFRSRIAATGADAAAEALLALVPLHDGARESRLINLLTSWRGPGLEQLVAAIAALGFEINELPQGAPVSALRRAARATASLVLDPDLLAPLASGLQERFGVPQLAGPLPIGAVATARLVHQLAALTGRVATDEAEPAPASGALSGRRIVLALAPAYGLALAEFVEDLGGEVAALLLHHVDRTHVPALASFARRRPDVQVHVGEAQGFETANLLRRLSPDVVVGGADAAAFALRLGIPAAVLTPSQLIGPHSAEILIVAIRNAIAGAALARRAAGIGEARYSPTWLRRSPDWHIKLEVK